MYTHLKQTTKISGTKNERIERRKTICYRYFKILLPITDRIKRKIYNRIEDLNTVNLANLINIYRLLYSMIAEYTFFSNAKKVFQNRTYATS